jgi:hypothetical protein
LEKGYEHYLRVAYIELTLTLMHLKIFPDVARALIEQMLDFDREKNSLLVAAQVADWTGDPLLSSQLREEAKAAVDKLPVKPPE